MGERRAVGNDGVAFVAICAFAVALYSSISNLFPFLEEFRPALVAAGLAMAALLFGRIAGGLPLTWDGGRGVLLLAYVGWAALSIRWSLNVRESQRHAAELFKLAAIYLAVVNVLSSPKRLSWVAGLAVLASLAPSLGAIDRWRSGENLVEGYRAAWSGVYADPNHLAMSLVAVVPAALMLVASSKRWSLRALGALAAGSAVTAIVLSHSRGGALGLLLAVLLFALTGAHKLRAIALVVVLGLGTAVLAPSSFWDRTETISTAVELDASARGRTWAWSTTAAINRDRPFQGVGAGAFITAWRSYAPFEARAHPLVAHNIFLSAIGDLGWVGFALFVLFLASAMASGMSAWKDPETGPLARALGAGLSGYVLCAMFSGYVLSAHFFFVTALAAAAGRVVLLRREARRAATAPAGVRTAEVAPATM